MSEWPWFICRQCAQRAPQRCDAHASGSLDETPYQTLTRWGSVEVVVRSGDADEMRAAFRRDARADRLRIRTAAVRYGDELALVIAWLADYKLSDAEGLERMHRAMRCAWGDAKGDDDEDAR